MTSSTIGHNGEIALPDAVRKRYTLMPDTPVRIIETRGGILLVPLTDAPMSAELVQELAEWQSLSAQVWGTLPRQENAEL
jgi:bifunctional DNA-binding transcriptional regulator/antitoxin component of YhaV-PrlF toxin-antitoxin module